MADRSPSCTELTDVIGRTGKYQTILIFLALYYYSFIGSSASFIQFLAPEVTLSLKNDTTYNHTVTFKSTKCHVHTNQSNENIEIYKFESHHRTLTEKLGMICDSSWMISLSKSSIQIGLIIGALLFGIFSERFGRRPFCKGVLIPILVANICIMFSSSYVLYIVSCFVYGMSVPSLAITPYISMIEHLPISVRPMFVNFATFSITLGECVTAILAWIIQDWFYTQLSLVIYIIPSLFFVWYMLESPMWLVVRGKRQEAENVLKTIANRNGRNLEQVEPRISLWIENTKKRSILLKSTKEGRLVDLFNTPVMRKYTLSLSWIMISANFPFYCLSTNVERFASNLYEDMLIGNAVVVVFSAIFTFFQSRTSVRMCNTFLSATFVVVACLYPCFYGYPVARTVLSCLLRGLCGPMISSTYAYSAEVFPTTVRGLGISFLRGSAGAASIMSPFTRELADRTTLYVPILLCGMIMLPNALLLLKFLPETKGKPLIHTVEELQMSILKKEEKASPSSNVHVISYKS